MNKLNQHKNDSARPLDYLILTAQPIDFTQTLNPQIKKISCTVGGLDKGKTVVFEKRNGALSDVAQDPTGSQPRYKYTLHTTTKFPTKSFQEDAQNNKPLSFRHIDSIEVESISGSILDIRCHAQTMNTNLYPLNKHLKEKPEPSEKEKTRQWENLLLQILKKIPLDEAIITKADTTVLEYNLQMLNKNRSSSLGFFSKAAILAVYANASWQILSNIGFMWASYLYMCGASLQEILPHFLSDANIPREHLESYVNQYLEAARLRPEELNARTLFSDSMNNIQFQIFLGSMLLSTLVTLGLIIKAICNRVNR